MSDKLKYIPSKGLIQGIKAIPYEETFIYIRKIQVKAGVMFEWLIPFEGEVYSAHIIINTEGEELTKGQIDNATSIIYAGAQATIDQLLGKESSDEAKEALETIQSVGDKPFAEA